MTAYVNLNGELLDASQPIFKHDNRGFHYGDGLFESIKLSKGQVVLVDAHLERIFYGLQQLKIVLNDNWGESFFKQQIETLVAQNGLQKKNGRVRLTIFRSPGGLYGPSNNEAEFLIDCRVTDFNDYPLNTEGVKLDLYSGIEKSPTVFSNLKTCNSLVYILASLHKKENGLDNCLILNSAHRIAEAINSNLFMVKGGQIITPPLTEGCVQGVMRNYLIDQIKDMEMDFIESPVAIEDIFQADEVMLTNTIQGLQWVGQYKAKTYECKLSKVLSQRINQTLIRA